MATYYIDGTSGSDANSGTNIALPRQGFPSGGASGDVYRLNRGSTINATSQIFYWDRQGVIITDYGNIAAPKPVVSVIMASGSHALNFLGDTIVHNVEFRNINRAAGETTDSLVGPNTLTFGTRGGAASGAADGVSGIIINCDFYGCTNNAINFAGINSEAHAAFAAPVGIVLGCDFDGLGGDGFFGAVKTYFEAGWNRFSNLGNRIDSSISGTPVGGRQSGSDAINLILAVPSLAWIHDCYVDHSTWDCKHSIMLDAPAAGGGSALAIVERNILIGYGAGVDGFRQSVNNVGINCEMRAIIRQNYIAGSRILMTASPTVDLLDIHSNIFDVLGVDGSNAAVSVYGDNAQFRNNSVIGRSLIAGTAVLKSSGADAFSAERNVVANFSTGFDISNSVQANVRRNAFYNVATPYSGMSADSSDIIATGAMPIGQTQFTPNDARLMFKSVDRRVPDFWGRFAPDGIGHIGATVGAW